MKETRHEESTVEGRPGRIRVVGIGPGSEEQMTRAVRSALDECDIVVGYSGYLKLIEPILGDKERVSTGMRGEVERVEKAVELALQGRWVALVSSGDPGIYGMAGLLLEILELRELNEIDLQILPGVTAAGAAASLLGAPLMHDFAVISLSDLLTGRELIRNRLRLAAEGDFVTVLYNPKSKSRSDLFADAVRIFREYRPKETPLGVVRNAYREDEDVRITSLEEIDPEDGSIDMLTVVIIGNGSSRRWGDFLITPRGYEKKRGWK